MALCDGYRIEGPQEPSPPCRKQVQPKKGEVMRFTRRRALGAFGAASAAAFLSAPTILRAQARYNWRFAHVGAIGSDQDELAKKFGQLVAEKSGGAVIVSDFPAGQLGGEQDLFQQVRGRALEFCIQGLPGIANLGAAEAMLLDLPYVVRDLDQGWALLNGEFGDWLRGVIETKTGNLPLAYLDNGFRNVFSRRGPISTVEDIVGLRLRVLQAPGYVTVYEHLGAVPVPLAYTEVYSALEAGVVDGGECSPKQLVQDRFYEVARFYNLTRINYNPVTFITNSQFFHGLPEEIRQVVTEATSEAIAHQSSVARALDEEMMSHMNERGVTVTEPDLDSFIEAVRPAVWDKLTAQIPNGEENVARLLASLETL